MKIDRRHFLTIGGGFVAGSIAGTTLSPLPWKLMDDSSIWTQNWPWTPVPEDGEAVYKDTVCTLCPGRCGISVRKIESRAVKIEGKEGYPVNNGGICMLGISGLQLLYGPTRVTTPLKKVNGKFKKISWDQAIGDLKAKLNELRSAGKSDTVACVSGSDTGITAELLKRFLKVLGSSNFASTSSINDSYTQALKRMQGIDANVGIDLKNADYVLSFGSGIIDGWESPVNMIQANSSLKTQKAKIIQVEPRLSNTAAKADKWLPIIPGTEKDLALGIINILISTSMYNKSFVDGNTEGISQLAKLSSAYSLDKVSAATGISKADISSVAKAFAKASRPIAICGRGQGDNPESMLEVMAVHALNALVGNINKKGGVFTITSPDYINWEEPELDATATVGFAKPRIDGAGSGKYAHTKYLAERIPEIVNAGKKEVNALFVAGCNPCYSFSNSASVKKAIEKIPFVVSFSSYLDDTSWYADLILPNHHNLERLEDVVMEGGYTKQAIGLAQPVVDPLFDTKNTGDVIIELAKAMGGKIADAFAWDNFAACLEETLGDKWETLSENGYWEGENAPTAPVQKLNFAAISGMPAITIEGDKNALTLIPYDSIRLSNDYIGSPPFLIKTVEDTVLKGNDILVEINPATAKKLNLSEGKYALLSTKTGKAKVKVHLFDGIRPGVIAMTKGLGHIAYDDYLAGKGINVNELIGPVEDPASGLDVAWGIKAKLTKA